MREIKFRAWDTDNKNWVPAEHGRETVLNYKTNYLVKPCTIELTQYTGLKDKNGKEIYEGDIVKSLGGILNPFTKYAETFTAVVKFESGCFVIEYQDNLSLLIDYELEVIGNIYENQDLLK